MGTFVLEERIGFSLKKIVLCIFGMRYIQGVVEIREGKYLYDFQVKIIPLPTKTFQLLKG